MTNAGQTRRTIIQFNWRLLLLTRLVIAVAAVAATFVVLQIWRAPFSPNHIYAVIDIILSCGAISRLRRAGWMFVGVHMLVSVIWCETAWNLPPTWFQ